MVTLHETVHYPTSQVLQKFVDYVITDIVTYILFICFDQMVQKAGYLRA